LGMMGAAGGERPPDPGGLVYAAAH
jgi:hypothetical protein